MEQDVYRPLEPSLTDKPAKHAKRPKLGHDKFELRRMEGSSIVKDEKSSTSTSPSADASSASSWVSPLCKHCNLIFEHWDQFVQEKNFRLSHLGQLSELKASAELGCGLCTQFMSSYTFQQSLSSGGSDVLTQHPLKIDSPVKESPKSPNTRVFLENQELGLPTGREGHIEMSPPGEGHGAIENTHRLHLVIPNDEGDDFQRYITVSLVPTDLSLSLDQIRVPTESSPSNTVESLQLCEEWLNRCSNSHKLCSSHGPQFVPTRLVCVEGDFPRLATRDRLSCGQKYATLSHCWGTVRFLTLTQGNLANFCNRIPSEALPKTFLDAILVCKQLGIGYIWIDSLCILQDDPKDWSYEAALMTKVYGNSHINIAAYGAPDGNAGLFFERSASWRCRVKISSKVAMLYDCVPFGMHHGSISWEPLSYRGWALQERLLPPRTLIFTRTQVFWECHESVACEIFLETYPSELRGSGIDTEDDILNGIVKKPISDLKWHNIIQQYTRRKFTFPEDRLVAISGLAREIQLHTNDTYYAGMWFQKLEVQLCWFPIKQSLSSDSQPVAPTWSWASIDTQISPTPHNEVYEDDHVYIKIRSLDVRPNEGPFGAICTAKLSLSYLNIFVGKLHQFRQLYSPESCFYVCSVKTRGIELLTLVYFSHLESVDWEKSCYFLPVFSFATAEDDPFIGTCLRGLVLQSSGTQSGHFRRIGLFTNDIDDYDDPGSGYRRMHEDFLTPSKSQDQDEMLTGSFEDDKGVIHKIITLV